jgi:glycosyltransferase involved in cell wall biosynthesis
MQRLVAQARKLLAGGELRLRFGYRNAIERLLLAYFTRELIALAGRLQPDLIHAHTPYYCGLPAWRASRRLGVPLVYEVRGVWEETAVSSGRFQREDRAYRRWRRLEDAVLRQADAVVCICEQLRQEVVSRGVDPQRVFVVPNAVDPVRFRPPSEAPGSPPPESVRRVAERLPGQTLGYIGSLRALEGVAYLVQAAALLVRQGHDVSLLVVGGGNNLDQLQKLAGELGLADRAVFTGAVPHEEVGFYYHLIDVFVVSRPPLRVTELVTPLKPLEAMAMGKALVVSDLPALRELAGSEETARFFKAGDAADLAQQCRLLLENRDLRQRMAHAARQWVEQHRNWSAVVRRLYPAYESALAARRAAA